MLKIVHGFFWLILIVVCWITFVFLIVFVIVVDEAMGFVDRKLNILFDDIC